jgi:hypothetical protein
MKNLYTYIKYLGLKKPVNLRIVTRKNRFADAEYEPEYSDKTGKLKEHNIIIYFKNNCRDFDTLVAHELIHAWQEENKKQETHGPFFIKYARKMEKEFNLREIYLPDIDEE